MLGKGPRDRDSSLQVIPDLGQLLAQEFIFRICCEHGKSLESRHLGFKKCSYLTRKNNYIFHFYFIKKRNRHEKFFSFGFFDFQNNEPPTLKTADGHVTGRSIYFSFFIYT